MELYEVKALPVGESVIKVPGGKMVRARVVFNDKVSQVRVSGDFFLHPEEAIHNLEEILKGVDNEEDLARLVEAFFKERGVVVIGATYSDFAKVLLDAYKKARGR